MTTPTDRPHGEPYAFTPANADAGCTWYYHVWTYGEKLCRCGKRYWVQEPGPERIG